MLVKPRKAVTFIFLLCASFLSGYGWSADWYVSANGSNNNPGDSQSAPFATMAKAMSVTAPGDTVYVMDGIYRNSGYGSGIDGSNLTNGNVLRITKSGSPGAPITLRNVEGHKPKIQFDGAGGINFAPNTGYITIEGFEIEGPSQSITYNQAIADRNYKILVAEDGDASTSYQNNYFSGRGIYGYGPHSNIIVRNNVVHDTPGSGIRFNDSDYMTIEYNEVYNTTWWTSSASSAIVYAESIALDGDNGSDIKMIMRGNVVYNNWNRIPFYVTQLPDNAGGPGGDYGTASQDYILDGQGLYVTRSDPSYAGTFLFENNLLVNNGKNGINFDHSEGASAIYRNNTLYFNGVHNIIQDLSVADGNPRHVGGNKVAGILANDVTSAVVANNIVVTRDSDYSALTFRNFSNKVVTNNIFRNGSTPDNFPPTVFNVDPKFASAPDVVNGLVDLSDTDFSLKSDSPAINAGNPNYSAVLDINKKLRPVVGDAVSSSSFETSENGWGAWSATLGRSTDESRSGTSSLLVSGRSYNYSSARLYLDGVLAIGESYSFSAWVKLADGASGSTKATIRTKTGDEAPIYIDWTTSDRDDNTSIASDSEWTHISGDYTHSSAVDSIFVYIKGPQSGDGLSDYYIDDVYIIPKGSTPPSFGSDTDIVDIGAYEYEVSNFAPAFTSSASFSVEENQTIIGTVTATDADSSNISFTVSGTELEITSAGILSFRVAPDYEIKSSYLATVTASDGTNRSTQEITVSVTDVDDTAPVFTSLPSFSVEENQTVISTVTATDVDSLSIGFTVSGTELEITSTGILSFKIAPDFEVKSSYSATLTASDGTNQSTQDITVSVSDVDDTAPTFTSSPIFSLEENQTVIGTVAANDVDSSDISFTVSGTELEISSAGILGFKIAADYEVKSSYSATVTASDGANQSYQNITVLVTDVDDTAPVFTSSAIFTVPENRITIGTVMATDADSSSISFTVSGAELEITSAGVLSFLTTPDYEVKSSYNATVIASDGTNEASQNISVIVTEASDVDNPTGTIDIDGNNKFDALTDGLLLLRSMFGISGDSLIQGVIADDATFVTASDIQERIQSLGSELDIDNNGSVDALTDGLLILRYLFELRGQTLLNGVVANNAARSTATDIELYLSALTSSVTAAAPISGRKDLSQIINGQPVNRSFHVHYPEVITKEKYPVVLFFHGAGGTGESWFNRQQVSNLIDDEKFIGIFPDGYSNRWNVSGETDVDDVEFVGLILNSLDNSLFDLEKVYGVGTSNGAGLVNKVGKETSFFKAIAPVISQQTVEIGSTVSTNPISVFQINGSEDNLVPIDGGNGVGGNVFMSAQGSAENWASSYDCNMVPTSKNMIWGGRSVQENTYSNCSNSQRVRYLRVQGAGHTTNFGSNVDLFDLIWEFFKSVDTESYKEYMVGMTLSDVDRHQFIVNAQRFQDICLDNFAGLKNPLWNIFQTGEWPIYFHIESWDGPVTAAAVVQMRSDYQKIANQWVDGIQTYDSRFDRNVEVKLFGFVFNEGVTVDQSFNNAYGAYPNVSNFSGTTERSPWEIRFRDGGQVFNQNWYSIDDFQKLIVTGNDEDNGGAIFFPTDWSSYEHPEEIDMFLTKFWHKTSWDAVAQRQYLKLGGNVTNYTLGYTRYSVFAHEMGHTFFLDDIYSNSKYPDANGLNSIMNNSSVITNFDVFSSRMVWKQQNIGG
jgi:poly(3-hydroxybutyrate) depolymerase